MIFLYISLQNPKILQITHSQQKSAFFYFFLSNVNTVQLLGFF